MQKKPPSSSGEPRRLDIQSFPKLEQIEHLDPIFLVVGRKRTGQTQYISSTCKCGCLDDALPVFNSIQMKSACSWNAMFHGLLVNGRGMEAKEMLREMEMEGKARPTEVTFLSVLCGCSHCDMVEEGKYYFDLKQRNTRWCTMSSTRDVWLICMDASGSGQSFRNRHRDAN